MKKFMLAVASAICLLLPVQVFAASEQAKEQKIEFNRNENAIEVAVTSPMAAKEEISSLQLSLKVASTGELDIRFIPDSRLPAKIVDSRYHKDTEILNIYVADENALFDKGSSACRLGSLVIESEDAAVTVSVLEGSLKYVIGTEMSVQNGNVTYPAAVNLNFKDSDVQPGGNENEKEDSPSVPGNEAASDESGVSGNKPGSGTSGKDSGSDTFNYISGNESGASGNEPGFAVSGNTSGFAGSDKSSGSVQKKNKGNAGEKTIPESGDTAGAFGLNASGLMEAIERASEYQKDEYTEESYQKLLKEVAKAKELLDTESATQEELDEAQLGIENAIGMLELRSENPVEQEKADSEKQKPEEKNDSQNRHILNMPLIVIIAAVLVVIAAAAAVVMLQRKKRRRD